MRILAVGRRFPPDVRTGRAVAFARLVTHYWANAAFMDDDHLVTNARELTGIPTYLAHGRMDISSPIDFPVALANAIPDASLVIAEADGHGGPTMTEHTITVTDRLAASWPVID